MIYFFADDHYGVHPGKVIFENLPEKLKGNIRFVENDWTLLESGDWLADCDLLVLNMIGTTCKLPHPGAASRFQRRFLGVGLVAENRRIPLGPRKRPRRRSRVHAPDEALFAPSCQDASSSDEAACHVRSPRG